MIMKNKIVHIIGAGPIGLVTAWKLLKKKISKLIFMKKIQLLGECAEHGNGKIFY